MTSPKPTVAPEPAPESQTASAAIAELKAISGQLEASGDLRERVKALETDSKHYGAVQGGVQVAEPGDLRIPAGGASVAHLPGRSGNAAVRVVLGRQEPVARPGSATGYCSSAARASRTRWPASALRTAQLPSWHAYS